MKTQPTLQEKGFAFGQAVNIAGQLLARRDEVTVEDRDLFKGNIKVLYKIILETREELRQDED